VLINAASKLPPDLPGVDVAVGGSAVGVGGRGVALGTKAVRVGKGVGDGWGGTWVAVASNNGVFVGTLVAEKRAVIVRLGVGVCTGVGGPRKIVQAPRTRPRLPAARITAYLVFMAVPPPD
jgi:hypothetical protein